ncbi:MAG: Fe-S cluster assembly protein SufD, partial [Candidatus Lutibacillus vidarii]
MPLLETTHHRHGDAPYVPDQSRAERLTSFEPADFGSPTGREEEWRFTPVDRLRALFRDEPTGLCLDWDEHLPEGVTSSGVPVEQWRQAGLPQPGDRAAAVAAARS